MKDPPDSIAELRNLGPKSAERQSAVGIETPEALLETGSVLACKILKLRFPRDFNRRFLYALEGALQGLHGTDCSTEEPARLSALASGPLELG